MTPDLAHMQHNLTTQGGDCTAWSAALRSAVAENRAARAAYDARDKAAIAGTVLETALLYKLDEATRAVARAAEGVADAANGQSSAPPVRCTGWMGEWESALAQLRKAGEVTPGEELTEDQWLRIVDAMWIMEEAIAAGWRRSGHGR